MSLFAYFQYYIYACICGEGVKTSLKICIHIYVIYGWFLKQALERVARMHAPSSRHFLKSSHCICRPAQTFYRSFDGNCCPVVCDLVLPDYDGVHQTLQK